MPTKYDVVKQTKAPLSKAMDYFFHPENLPKIHPDFVKEVKIMSKEGDTVMLEQRRHQAVLAAVEGALVLPDHDRVPAAVRVGEPGDPGGLLRAQRPRHRPALPGIEELRHDHPAPGYQHHRLLQLPSPRRLGGPASPPSTPSRKTQTATRRTLPRRSHHPCIRAGNCEGYLPGVFITFRSVRPHIGVPETTRRPQETRYHSTTRSRGAAKGS